MLTAALNATAVAAGDAAGLLQAFEEGSLGVSFGIAGFLVGYLAGVAYLLQELGIITPATKVAGASSGALLSLGLCSGLSPQAFTNITQQLCNTCRQHGNCQGTLGAAVASCIPQILPPDAYQQCSKRAYMSITTGPFPATTYPPSNLFVSEYSSNDDLAAAASASSYIPLWSGKKAPTTTFRGMPAYDGFFSNSQPCPPSVKACIKINSKTPPWDNTQLGAFFDIFSRIAHVGPLRPPRLAALASIVSEAAPAADSNSQQQQQQQGSDIDPAAALRAAAKYGLDIAPGIYSKTRMAPQAWEELIVLPGDEALNKYLWDLGRKDAQIWARATGLEAAAAAKKARVKAEYKQG